MSVSRLLDVTFAGACPDSARSAVPSAAKSCTQRLRQSRALRGAQNHGPTLESALEDPRGRDNCESYTWHYEILSSLPCVGFVFYRQYLKLRGTHRGTNFHHTASHALSRTTSTMTYPEDDSDDLPLLADEPSEMKNHLDDPALPSWSLSAMKTSKQVEISSSQA
jgi:hypothetical protein